MSHPGTARRGNSLAALGMAAAIVGTFASGLVEDLPLVVLGACIGTALGVPAALGVKMTAMPQMVALFNGVGGGAVALIAWAEFRGEGEADMQRLVPALIAAMIGTVAFFGSLIAFGKLQGIVTGRPVRIPGGSLTDAILAGGALTCVGLALAGVGGEWAMIGLLACAALFGIALVLPIGGADMPVVISLLNAFTGLSAAAYGIALDNVVLIVAGALVGASGSILTRLMAEAMNRPLLSIIAGGFGGDGSVAAAGAVSGERTYRSTTPADVAIQLAYADRVLIVPGYGLAVAHAQHAVRELGRLLEEQGVEVAYGIHPVAGRMPGHMNVLLAEADVPYSELVEYDAANAEMTRTDCALVIGANDVVNPAAKEDPTSPIYGMPIIDVSLARSTIVLKRSMASGYAGIENPLFFNSRCQMLFGDAKGSVSALVDELRALLAPGSRGHSHVV
jgi:NAD(P) transhydrogenase subunit beta